MNCDRTSGRRAPAEDEQFSDAIVYRGIPDYDSERWSTIYVATVRAARASTMVAEACFSKHISASAEFLHKRTPTHTPPHVFHPPTFPLLLGVEHGLDN